MTRQTRRSHAKKDGRTISARNARQGEIILTTPSMRAVFIAGLILALLVALAAGLLT
ncbi:hypothetical protein V6C03_11460 [Methyloligella sp. 2.7D]|uniref:hypothetical protein n=1 Tax=unclassified Methyloligella TaxID=2625955 RepID=UPI00157C7CAE|nr:hypothetical protein [Methyloligella sp. GL2]QKP77570.1 hypothetical protein HT051_09000 [Methyloligella sp. GL2]